MNLLDYTLAEVRKALIALVGFGGFAVLFLIQTDFDPGFVAALQTLVPAGFAVITVFAAPYFSEEDFSKAILGFISAGVGVYNYFGEVDSGTIEVLVVMAGYAGTFLAVFFRRNETPINLEPPVPVPGPADPPVPPARRPVA